MSFTRFLGATARSMGALAGVMLMAQSASAQVSDNWEEVVAAAKEEGRLNYYSVMVPAQNDALIRAFNEAYPEITVTVTRGASELPARLAAEWQAGIDGADVFSLADPVWFATNADELLVLDTPHAPDFPAENWAVPEKAPDLNYSPLGFLVWNTQRWPDGLSDWDDLLNPELRGRIGTREGMTATLAAFLEFITVELGEEYFQEIGKQDLKFYNSTLPLTQAVASGEVWVANAGSLPTIRQLQEQGAPIDFALPDPSFANPQIGAALARSQRPNAAVVFMDFAMSPAGQQAMNRGVAASALSGLEDTMDVSGFRVFDPTRYTPEVREQWQGTFDQYWRP